MKNILILLGLMMQIFASYLLMGQKPDIVYSNPSSSNEPDLTVCYIKRLPEINYVENSTNPERDGWPAMGQNIKWRAYVKNYSPNTVSNVSCMWFKNNMPVEISTIPIILPYSMAYVDLDYSWDFTRNELKFLVDYKQNVKEVNETNNELIIYTDAISVHFYVEQSVYDHFHKYQCWLKAGTNCWEDWAQILHVKRWNKMFADAIYEDSPNGVLDRVRIDSIAVVPTGSLPLYGGYPSNNPNNNDKTVDLQWGFANYLLNDNFYKNYSAADDTNAFFFEGSLLHELGHARYLTDINGFHVPDENNSIQIYEGGIPIVGTYLMPHIICETCHRQWVHFNDYEGLMGYEFSWIDPNTVQCMNLIAGHRAVCGNMNSPCNIDIYLNDLPTENVLTISDQYGNLIPNASVKFYQASSGYDDWYAKVFDNSSDLSFSTDQNGQVAVGKCPFSNSGEIIHSYGFSNGTVIIRVESNGKIGYTFLESTRFNMEYWKGNTWLAVYDVTVNMFGTPLDVTITKPKNWQMLKKCVPVTIEAQSRSQNIKKVDFFINNKLLGLDCVYPYTISFDPNYLTMLDYKLKVILYGDNGDAVSDEVAVHFVPNSNEINDKPSIPTGAEYIENGIPTLSYKTTGLIGARSYLWSLVPVSSGTITGNSTSAIVNFNNDFWGKAKITVTAENYCGKSEPSDTLNVYVGEPIQKYLTIYTPTSGQLYTDCNDSVYISYRKSVSHVKKVNFYIDGILIGTRNDDSFLRYPVKGYQQGVHNLIVELWGIYDDPLVDTTTFTIDISDDQLPDKPGTPTGNDKLCAYYVNDQTYITNGASKTVSYEWIFSPQEAGTITGTGTAATVHFSDSYMGNAKIAVRGQNACGTGPMSNSLIVEIRDCDIIINPPFPNIINEPFTIECTTSSEGIKRINFYLDGLLIDSDSLDSYTFTIDPTDYEPGDHIIQAIAVFGDSLLGVSNEVTITIGDPFMTVPEETNLSREEQVRLYPNPAHGLLNIELYEQPDEIVNFEIIDICGQIQLKKQLNNKTDQINLEGLRGLYLVKVSNSDFNFIEKLVIQ